MIGEHDARSMTARALELAEADQAEAMLYGRFRALTRFANNSVHQNVAEQDLKLYLRVVVGGRAGSSTTSRMDDESLRTAAKRARAAAAQSSVDPALEIPAGTTSYGAVAALDPEVVECSPERRADEVRQVCEQAMASRAVAFGAMETELKESAYANSREAFAYHAGSRADFQTVIRRDGASGWASDSSWRLAKLPVSALGEQAIRRAVDGERSTLLDPEPMPVVLDPYATADLVGMLNAPGMGAKAFAEGRSWMVDRIGTQAMSELVSIWDDGLDADGLPATFDSEGTAKRRVELVTAGVIQGPVYDRATARQAGTQSSGHALPLDLRQIARRYSPVGANLFMAPGEHSTEQLIASTGRGLYITRFWYTRHVHPRDCVVTGMTRDGVALIEDGKLTRPVKDLRFTQSYVEALRDVEAVGSEARLLREEFLGSTIRAPAVKIRSFRFTGSTV